MLMSRVSSLIIFSSKPLTTFDAWQSTTVRTLRYGPASHPAPSGPGLRALAIAQVPLHGRRRRASRRPVRGSGDVDTIILTPSAAATSRRVKKLTLISSAQPPRVTSECICARHREESFLILVISNNNSANYPRNGKFIRIGRRPKRYTHSSKPSIDD